MVRTRSPISRRMLPEVQQVLLTSVNFARNSSKYCTSKTRQEIAALLDYIPVGNQYGANFHSTFQRWFNIDPGQTSLRRYRDYMERFRRICSMLDRELHEPLELVDSKLLKQLRGRTLGYINTTNEKRRIHLNVKKIKSGNEWELANTIVHEATHKFCHTTDSVNINDKEMDSIPPLRALDNAESLGYTIIQLYQSHHLGRQLPILRTKWGRRR